MQFFNRFKSAVSKVSTPKHIVISLIVALVGASPFFAAAPTQNGQYFFEIQITPEARGTAQLFYDVGSGINEEDAIRRSLTVKGRPTVLRMPLPSGAIHRFRFDPIDQSGKISISNARVIDIKNRVLVGLPVDQFLPVNDIAATNKTAGGQEVVLTCSGSDPYLMIPLPSKLVLPSEFLLFQRIIHAAPVFLLLLFAVSGANLLLLKINKMPVTTGARTEAAQKQGMGGFELGDRRVVFIGIALGLFKLWLVSGQTICALVDAGHDDQLFLNLAHNILGGRWLGSYSHFTLVKGPMYSLFVAGVFLLGIPLFTAQHLLYTLACVAVVRALRPLGINRWLLLLVFTVLLFNPVTYDAGAHTRVLRQQILPALALLITAGGIGLYTRREWPLRRLLPWALVAGVSLPAFWLTREDGVWILPCVGVLWASIGFMVWRARFEDWIQRLVIVMLPFVFWLGGIGTVSWLNYTYYGVFTTCEFQHPAFKAAYGSLVRITPQRWIPYNPIPKEVRERAYAVSPSFAELKPYLEGSIGESWASAASSFSGIPAKERELSHGFFMWALRDAVCAAGHTQSSGDAMAFYTKMAREINDACDRGLIIAGPRRSGFLPPWRNEFTSRLPDALSHAMVYFISFEQLTTIPSPSGGSPQNFARFEDLTRGRLTPAAGRPSIPRRQRWLDGIRTTILKNIMDGYQFVSRWAATIAIVSMLVATSLAVIRRQLSFLLILSVALLGSCLALALICSLVEITAFPAIVTMYFTGSYGMWLFFVCSSCLALADSLCKPVQRDS